MSARVYVTGNLGSDPELAFGQDGAARLRLSVAATPRRKDRATDQWSDDGDPVWLGVTVWGEEAQVLADTLHKGDRVILNGTLRRRVYERRDGGRGEALDLTGVRDLAVVPKARPRQPQAPRDDPWPAQTQQPQQTYNNDPAPF